MDDFDQAFNELAGAPAEPSEPADEPQMAAADAEPPEPAPETKPEAAEPADATKEAESPSPATIDDLFNLVPKERAEAFAQVVQRIRSDLGRVAALNQLYNEQKASVAQKEKQYTDAMKQLDELKAKASKINDQSTSAEVTAVHDDADELERQFPELAKAVKLTVTSLIEKRLPAKEATDPPPQAPSTSTEPGQESPPDGTVDDRAKQFAALEAAHPDWHAQRNRPEFVQWFKDQPASMQKRISSNSADDAILVLDAFKRDLKASTDRAEAAKREANRKRLEENVGVRGTPPRVTAPPNDFEAAFNFFAARPRQ